MLERVLRELFPNLPQRISYSVIGAEFAPTLESVLDGIERREARLAPTFAFLDPFGFSGLPMRLIARLLGYDKCEVLITFMTGFVNRFNDEFRENTLNELFGTVEWRQIRSIDSPEERRNFLINLYLRQLKNVGGATYAKSFEMIGPHNQTLYHLVFGTKHIKGLEVMKESMWAVDRRGTYRFSDITDVGQSFLIDYTDESHWVPSAAEMVYQKFRGQTVAIELVRDFVIADTPFIFRRAILRHIESANLITDVMNRRRRFTYPDDCMIAFAE